MKLILSLFFVSMASNAVAQKKRQPATALSASVGKVKLSSVSTKAVKPTGHMPSVVLTNKRTPPTVAKLKPVPSKIFKRKKIDQLDSLAHTMQAQLQWPFAQCDIIEPFGHNDMGSYTLYNPGITLSSPAPVMAKACYDAVIENITIVEGRYVVLAQHNGIYFGYSNLEDVVIKKGDLIKKGDAIGTLAMDDNGNYSLLFLLQLKNKETNPHPWFMPRIPLTEIP